jgi:hypothetical protein
MQDEETIAPQNFKLAECLGFLAIISLFIQNCCDQTSNAYYIALTINSIAYIWLLFCFKKYLKNFKSDEAIARTWWYIMLNIGGVVIASSAIILKNTEIGMVFKNTPGVYSSLLIIGVLIVIGITIMSILVGDTIRRIENDFVGLLKACGLTTMCLLPLVYLLIFVKGFIHFDAKFPEYSIPIHILFGLIMDIPTVIMIMIFARAERRVTEITQ